VGICDDDQYVYWVKTCEITYNKKKLKVPQCQCPRAPRCSMLGEEKFSKDMVKSRQHSHGDVPLKQKLLRYHVLLTNIQEGVTEEPACEKENGEQDDGEKEPACDEVTNIHDELMMVK
jgi:hypothetical protein